MIRAFISIVVIVVGTIGLGMYLQPDDLSDCTNLLAENPGCIDIDTIVAISGGDTNARADKAISLYKSGLTSSKTIIFSGAAQDKSGPSNAAVMKERAIEAGVPESSIFIDEESESTKENAKNVQKIFDEQNIHNAVLVTSGYHQRRAFLEFEKNTKSTIILNSPVQSDQDWSPFWWLTLRGWLLAASEIIKIIAFYVTGIWS